MTDTFPFNNISDTQGIVAYGWDGYACVYLTDNVGRSLYSRVYGNSIIIIPDASTCLFICLFVQSCVRFRTENPF